MASVINFQDFKEGSKEGRECLETLSVLHKVRKLLDDFQENNKELFTEKDKIN